MLQNSILLDLIIELFDDNYDSDYIFNSFSVFLKTKKFNELELNELFNSLFESKKFTNPDFKIIALCLIATAYKDFEKTIDSMIKVINISNDKEPYDLIEDIEYMIDFNIYKKLFKDDRFVDFLFLKFGNAAFELTHLFSTKKTADIFSKPIPKEAFKYLSNLTLKEATTICKVNKNYEHLLISHEFLPKELVIKALDDCKTDEEIMSLFKFHKKHLSKEQLKNCYLKVKSNTKYVGFYLKERDLPEFVLKKFVKHKKESVRNVAIKKLAKIKGLQSFT